MKGRFLDTFAGSVPVAPALSQIEGGRDPGSERAEWRRGGAVKVCAVFAVLAVFLLLPHPALAQGVGETIGSLVAKLVAHTANIFVFFAGQLLLILIEALIVIARYNDFITAPAIANGWIIVRDLANMAVVVVLLVLAFGTMVGSSKYNIKNRALVQLLLMAVIINFSRTICGILIDASQVVMLTFVAGFSEAAGGNFTEAMQLNKLMALAVNAGAANMVKIALSMILAGVMLVISIGVVIIMLSVLVFRIVTLWLLVVMSPLAFLLRAVPGGAAGGYYGQWWSMFTGQLVVGPLLAFFLWLSLITVATGGTTDGFKMDQGAVETASDVASAAFDLTAILPFFISICLLLAGVMFAQKLSGQAVGVGKKIANRLGKTAVQGAKLVGKGGLFAADKVTERATRDRETGKGYRMSDLAGAYKQKFVRSGVGRAVGLDKEYNETAEAERRIAVLKATGQFDKAAAEDSKLNKKRAEEMSKATNADGLRKTADDPNASKRDKQAALLALAEQGDRTLMGKGGELRDIVSKAGGSKELELQIRKALKAAGDNDAMLGADPDKNVSEQIREQLATGGKGDKAKMYGGIAKGVALGIDGKPVQTHAQEKLLELDEKTFNDFNTQLQEEVKNALALAVSLEEDPDKQRKLIAQNDRLTGEVAGEEFFKKGGTLKAEMERKNAAARVGAKLAGVAGAPPPIDAKAAEILSAGDQTAIKEGVYDRLDAMKLKFSKGESVDAVELQEIIDEIGRIASAAPVAKAVNAKGESISNLDLVKQSTLFKNLESAMNQIKEAPGGVPPKGVEKFISEAMTDVDRTMMSDELKKSLAQTTREKKYSQGGLGVAEAGFADAAKEADLARRQKLIKKAASQGASAIRSLLKRSEVQPTPAVEKELKELAMRLKEMKKKPKGDVQGMEDVEKVRKEIDRLSKLL